ncbi:type IV pilus assembly protein PilC [Geoalkalibacter ferrihydriticus]|uniref:Type II secretion system protein n=2 Tax=Geoalkalibacter ferrihydriticus TaxID=392333 RepID=A0A0C2HHH5_9BACT|nr:type II secretion system F family protein [Geoalkalibacter ferrihydriticus]KIH76446.1 type II secretion system protein [Geoalkalibacter ferrihydriticus DSM 17813]SDL95449.1 type IV pilus assembly protein PilC [Geoalkalibacter ferrihydriticus]
MPTFKCKIGMSDGRVVEKEFESPSRQLLAESLQEQGFHVFSLRKIPFQSLRQAGAMGPRFSGQRFLSFNQEFLVLLRSGLPILQVLDTLMEKMEVGAVLAVLREVREDIKGGGSLSDAFEKFPRYFPYLYVASIRAGERTGDLPVTLARYLDYQRRMEAIKARIRSASFYPVFLSVVVTAVVLLLMVYVVPRFTQIYADAQVDLPLLTRVVIALAEGLGRYLPLVVLASIVAFVAGRIFVRSEQGGYLLDRLKLRVPFFGALLADYSISSFCRTLSTTIAGGIPAVEAMRMSRATLNNRVLEERLLAATRRVEEGMAISESFEKAAFFPNIALRMIGVGESTGALAEMLNEVADYYEQQVGVRLDRLTTLIEPVMMLVMGLLIGGIVVAMYFPIFQLAGTVQ